MASFHADVNIEPRKEITADFVIYPQITSVEWGSIIGTLTNQTDLQNALDNKQATISDLETLRTNANNGNIAYNTISGYGNIVTHNANEFYLATNPSNFATETFVQNYHDNTKQNVIENLVTIESNASNGNTAFNTISGYGNIVTHNTSEFATSAQGTKADSALQSTDVINNVTSTTTDKPLSANMGKELQDEIDNLKARGRFLALWNCTTGLAETQPTTLPYDYKTGDYFIIGTVGETNYKPSGSEYTGTASTVVETSTVSADDVYYYDGNVWHLQINTQKTVSFANIAGQPTDNSNLASALNSKQPTIDSSNKLSSDLVDDTNHTNKFVSETEKSSWNNKQDVMDYVITENMVTVEQDATKGVSPYNTSYGYTNITINDTSIEWKLGASYYFVISSKMVVASAYRNVRVRIGTSGDWKPVYLSSSIASGSSYFTKAYNTICKYKTTYQSAGALHILSDNNTTYSAITATEIATGTATTAKSVTAKVLNDWLEAKEYQTSSQVSSAISSAVQPRLDDLNVQYKETTVPEETLDLSTITVSSEGATYGYSYNSNTDRLQPDNSGINSSFAYGKISFTVTSDRTLSISIYQKSEQGYDYGVVSNLDQTLEQSTSLDSEYKWYGKTVSTATETLEYDLTAGEHFITFKYIKDSSSATSPDMMAITEIKLGETTTKALFDYDTGEEIETTPDLSDYMTLDTEQTATAKKIFSFTEPIAFSGQESIVKVLSTHTNSEISSQPMWAGRMIIGAKDRTFLMGVYHASGASKSLCGLGAHSWSNAFAQTGAAWEDVYIQPDGNKATYIGGYQWNADSGWLKVQNSGATTASYKTYINTGTATSPSWKTVLPNMNTGTNSVFITPYISDTSSYSYSVSMGYGATPTNTYATNIGYSAQAGSYGASFGSSATASGTNSVALGASSTASGSYSIQLGQGTNSTANTMYVGLSDSLNVQLLDSTGVIPVERIDVATLLQSVSGYDSTKTQVLKNVAGTFTWVDEE